jgi:diguanylate cyclase (GGDEF)-like protein
VARGCDACAREKLEGSNVFSFWAAKYSQPLLVSMGQNSAADAFLSAIGAVTCLTVPLFVSNRVTGSVQLFSSNADAFTKDDAQLIWILSLVAENLLTKESKNEGLIRFAFTDFLTGLRSRGYFEQQLELEIKRAERKRTRFALLMLDIDYFKKFNDEYGHHVGDQVLRDVSSILARDMREVDTVARYGGEEFVIILPETGLRGALQVAERLRHNVEQTRFFIGQQGQKHPITISIGVAIYGDDGRNRTELMEAADAALYHAKDSGRNRIVTHGDTTKRQHQTG